MSDIQSGSGGNREPDGLFDGFPPFDFLVPDIFAVESVDPGLGNGVLLLDMPSHFVGISAH